MPGVAAIGEQVRVQGFALAGVHAVVAETPAAVHAAWVGLPDDVSVVILTAAAADLLRDLLERGEGPLSVVMPP